MTHLTPALLITASGSCVGSNITCVAYTVLSLINNVFIPVIFAIAFLTFLYGVAKTFIFSHGEGGAVEKGKQIILWGLIGFVIMVTLWGIINMVSNTFGLAGSQQPLLPQWTPSATF